MTSPAAPPGGPDSFRYRGGGAARGASIRHENLLCLRHPDSQAIGATHGQAEVTASWGDRTMTSPPTQPTLDEESLRMFEEKGGKTARTPPPGPIRTPCACGGSCSWSKTSPSGPRRGTPRRRCLPPSAVA